MQILTLLNPAAVSMLRLVGKYLAWTGVTIASALTLLLSAAFLYLNPQIPETQTFSNVTIKAPMRIYSSDQKLIQEFGERLTPISYGDIPELFIRALLDTEDKRFFDHGGIDLITLLNASWKLISSGGNIQTGASTITMQLVKNISGDSQIRFIRKFKEMLLAIKIEREMKKEDILELYLNIIPYGKHSFGVQAASNTYYGKNIDELNLAQLAMLAGIPKKPEGGNPVNGPEWALDRRNLVLRRMLDQGSIDAQAYETAINSPITAGLHKREIELSAMYIAELARRELLEEFGQSAYTSGLIVHTTIDSQMQHAAQTALRTELEEYDLRHGYRGPEYRRIKGTEEFLAAPESGYPPNWLDTLNNVGVIGNMHPAIVTAVDDQSITVLARHQEVFTIEWDGLKWARPYINVNARGRAPAKAEDIVAVGDFIRITKVADQWHLSQVPDIQGALAALSPTDGSIKALVGGYDFIASEFNHATQAKRQPGSNFKPFFYAGALENGLTAATIFNDAPILLPGGELEEDYRPRNSGDRFQGDISLREALYRSINLVSLRVILDYEPENAVQYVTRFGFDTSNFPENVQLAFGGGTIGLSPMDLATGYASFANGGYKITPWLIARVESINQDTLLEATPAVVCNDDNCTGSNPAPGIIEPRVAYIMDTILSDVIRRGTGTKARRALQRDDLRGKTGTTNDADIWFSGYTTDLVATVWAGFDDNSPVGSNEWGSTIPLETWIAFMAEALPPESNTFRQPMPDGLVTVRIDRDTGLRVAPDDPDGVYEFFRKEYIPESGVKGELEEPTRPIQDIF